MGKVKKEALSGKTKKVTLFFDGDKYKDPVYVGLNGMSWLIQRGVEVEVPVEVAEILEHSAEQDAHTAAMLRNLSAEAEKMKEVE